MTISHKAHRIYSLTDHEEDKTQVVDTDNILSFVGSQTSLIAPFDIDEDGKLDIIAQRYSEDGNHDL